jgi:hypothetical protein
MTDAEAQHMMRMWAKRGKGAAEAESKEAGSKVLRIPAKKILDRYVRVEIMYGCEIPVCVGRRCDMDNTFLQTSTGPVMRRLVRTAIAGSKLPGPAHYAQWMLALDRWREAAKQGVLERPWIEVYPEEYQLILKGEMGNGGTFYKVLDEGFRHFSHLVVNNVENINTDEEIQSSLGTLCDYVSWRHKKRGCKVGLLRPGPEVWKQIRELHLKQIDFEHVKTLGTYTAQRLYVYLCRHFGKDKSQWSIGLNKLLPKIPMKIPQTPAQMKETRNTLRKNHRKLVEIGFLEDMPTIDEAGTLTYFITQRQKQLQLSL